jgi:diguanylate cyclase (GGDEF)-like protein
MHTLKKKFFLLLVFLGIYFALFFVLSIYQESRTNDMLEEQENYLEISYKQGLDRFHTVAQNVYSSIKNDKKIINLVATTNSNNIKEKHDAIYRELEGEFEHLKLYGVLGIQITNPKNISIVRMHEKKKYWDDLSEVRPMMAKVNELHIYLHGFEEGKTSHAFREIFPLFKDGTHIGAMEVLFSSTKLQDYTMRVSDIHTHFIVNRNVFKTNEWKSKSQDPYAQSIENEEYLFSKNYHQKHDDLNLTTQRVVGPLKKEIAKHLQDGENFYLYKMLESDVKVLVFLAVQRFVDNKTVAYLVSYTNMKKLYDFIETMNVIKAAFFVLTLLLYIITIRLLLEKETALHELKYDDLTKVHTRKHFMKFVKKESKRLDKNNEVFCIVMADIDHFKSVNDTYGHQYGDSVLSEFATLLEESTRSIDVVARYGGEEFVILLHTNAENAYKVIDHIRQKVEKHRFGKDSIELTASFGITESKDGSDVELKVLIAKADEALYKAKENGRNQVQMQ